MDPEWHYPHNINSHCIIFSIEFLPCNPGEGGACWSVVYRCVNKKKKKKKKTMRKGTFFELGSARRYHHLG